MVRKQKQKTRVRKRKVSPIKRLKCEDCGEKALVGMLYAFESCTDPEFYNKPGASIWFLCLACGMNTAIRHLTSDEITNLAIAAKKDGRQFCTHCGRPIDKKQITEADHAFGDCPKCGGGLG